MTDLNRTDWTEAIAALAALPAATAYEAMGRSGDLSPDIRALFGGAHAVGRPHRLEVVS